MNTKIVLIVGPSGVGKDTLLKEVRKSLDGSFNFINRYITRKPCKSEDNFYLDEYAFEILKHNSFFISTWNAHGNYYGIAKKSIKNGINIISISRSKVKDFENSYDNVYTINISVSKENLRRRLENRGRESKEEIEKRLNRSYQKIESKNLIEFDNSEKLEITSKKFLELLKSIENE
ncbi:AAA family ATPase [Arcobacter sp. LA11]|uniref:AAA family ATPase n=1 Tax=Arcobacter sp. LA11 TaxID=1898176 RepID=UPI000932945A|nr:AAA family ATPase [Arcobacter sp. LA11]